MKKKYKGTYTLPKTTPISPVSEPTVYDDTKKNLAIICFASLLTIGIIAYLSLVTFKSFVDVWGYTVYFDTNVIPFLMKGELPYVGHHWEYPTLMLLPVALAAIPSVMMRDEWVFIHAFRILMIICNFVIIYCTYNITLAITDNKIRALTAASLYAVSITAAYIVVTNYDPLPVAFMMLCLMYTINNSGFHKVYVTAFLGFFAKIFPILILPFVAIYNAKKSSYQTEAISVAVIGGVSAAILFLPFYALNRSAIDTYLITTASGKGIFVSSLVYTVYMWVHTVFGLPVSSTLVAQAMTGLLAITMAALVYISYIQKKQDPVLLLTLSLIALTAVIAFSKYHSPQYMLWIMPILCILAAGNLIQMGIYYLLQIIWYIKFPLAFYALYNNVEYTKPIPAFNGYLALLLFTVEYSLLFYLVYSCSNKKLREALK